MYMYIIQHLLDARVSDIEMTECVTMRWYGTMKFVTS